ncbi:unnamed protein product [Haemonchus placei]|uniref:Phosphotransferase n=1 Tax=Haemonchus placei TaxID=6290 RepID=A0A0N4WRZ6_HAEPC|nr:unnamed protein product [Haemonchus placei]
MIIDIEWGGFGDRGDAEYIRTQYDRIVDERSDHPGSYCFDKLVAGKCMGEVVRLVLEKLCTLKVSYLYTNWRAIACVLNRIGQPKMIVAIDGSTYKCHPFFEHWISEKVKELLDPGLKVPFTFALSPPET